MRAFRMASFLPLAPTCTELQHTSHQAPLFARCQPCTRTICKFVTVLISKFIDHAASPLEHCRRHSSHLCVWVCLALVLLLMPASQSFHLEQRHVRVAQWLAIISLYRIFGLYSVAGVSDIPVLSSPCDCTTNGSSGTVATGLI